MHFEKEQIEAQVLQHQKLATFSQSSRFVNTILGVKRNHNDQFDSQIYKDQQFHQTSNKYLVVDKKAELQYQQTLKKIVKQSNYIPAIKKSIIQIEGDKIDSKTESMISLKKEIQNINLQSSSNKVQNSANMIDLNETNKIMMKQILEQNKDQFEKLIQDEAFYQQPETLFENPFQSHSIIKQNHETFIRELEKIIYSEIKSIQQKELKDNFVLKHATDDLDLQIQQLQDRISNRSLPIEDLLNTRMHIQAVAKIMVFVHGRSEFRLVSAHYYLGDAYRINGCYEQAIDHFTIALKKNAKLFEIKETKVYHSFIFTSLSQCYFELEMYSDALQILIRAYEIQQSYVNSEFKINNIKTIRLISECYLRMKKYSQAIEYIEKNCLIIEKLKGTNSLEYAQIKFQKAVIVGSQGNLLGAIEQVRAAIGNILFIQELIKSNSNVKFLLQQNMILHYYKKLGQFLQKFGDLQSQISCLKDILLILGSQKFRQNIPKKSLVNQIIAIKKKIIVIAIKHSNYQIALSQLEQILVILNRFLELLRVLVWQGIDISEQDIENIGFGSSLFGKRKASRGVFKKMIFIYKEKEIMQQYQGLDLALPKNYSWFYTNCL